MLNVFKMDMRRMLRSKMFYVCLFSMILVTGSMIIFGVVPDFASIMGAGATGTEDAMMGNMMGIGMAFMVIGIYYALYICQEFTSGFAKNIFARHANPLQYVGGKLLSLTVTGSIMLLAFVFISIILMAIVGGGIVLPGGIIGLITFLISKIFACATFASFVLFMCVLTRKSTAGIIAGIVVAMGAIPMVLGIAGNFLGLTWISNILKFTISGLSNMSNLTFGISNFAVVIVGNLIWMALLAVSSNRAVKLKDI